MGLFPAFGNIGEEFVMRPAYNIYALEPDTFKPTAAAGEMNHIAIEHKDRGGRMLHKAAQTLLALAQYCRRIFLGGIRKNDF